MEHIKIITIIEIFHALGLQNHLMFVMVANLEVVVEKKDNYYLVESMKFF